MALGQSRSSLLKYLLPESIPLAVKHFNKKPGKMKSCSLSLPTPDNKLIYRGRLAPSPTGFLHLGHAKTFYTAYQRALEHNGTLLYRNEDLDFQRCKEEFIQAAEEDLHWLGIHWQPPVLSQSKRLPLYRQYLEQLKSKAAIYPCTCSRKEIALAATAPHDENSEPIYPGFCRKRKLESIPHNQRFVWRFRVPDGEVIHFTDGRLGKQTYIAGKDFGDFIIWRHDDIPSYQLAVVVDDALTGVNEVVRGEDLLLSTARQLLLYRALGLTPPNFYHTPLLRDSAGHRLAKRSDSLSLRTLRSQGFSPEDVLKMVFSPNNPSSG